MSTADSAVFQEVLEISVDSSFFAAEMQKIEDIYAASIANMPSLGDVGAASLANQFSSLALQLEKTSESVQGVVDQSNSAFENMGAAAADAFVSMTDAINDLVSKLEGVAPASEEAGAATDRLSGAVSKQEAAERARFKMIEQAEAEMRKYIATVEAAAAANEKVNSPKAVVGEGVTFGPPTRDEAEEEMRKMAALQERAQAMNEKMNTASEKAVVGNGVAFGPQTFEEADAEYRKMAALQERAITENEKMSQSNEKTGSTFSAFGSRIGTMVETMAEFYLIFKAFEAIKDVVSAPIIALKEGFTYLEGLQEQASQIKAVLLDTEVFDANPAKNMAMAADEADRLARGVQDLAAKLHVSAPIIRAGFDTFLGRGGGNLTQSNDDSLQLAGMAAAALQNQLPTVNARFQATELTKLVQGTLSATSKLAGGDGFGPSAEKLNEMAKAAFTTHDLLQRIIANSPGLTERLGSANSRMDSLVAATDLLKQRFEGLIAGPVFDKLTGWLNAIQEWFEKNQATVEEFGRSLGDAVGHMADGIAVLVKSDWQTLLGSLKAVAQTFINIAWALSTVVSSATLLGALKDKLQASVTATGPEADSLRSEKEDIDSRTGFRGQESKPGDNAREVEIKKRLAAIQEQQAAQAEQELGAATNAHDAMNSAFITATNDLSSPVTPVANKPATPAKPTQKHGIDYSTKDLPAIGKETSEQLKQLEAEYQHLRDVVKEVQEDRAVSAREAATEIIRYNDAEIADIQRLADAEKAKVDASSGTDATPEKKSQEKAAIQSKADEAIKAARHSSSEAEQSAAKEAQDIEKENTNALVALAKQRHAEELAEDERAYENGKITRTQLAKARIAIAEQEYQDELTVISKRMDAISSETVEYAQLANKRTALQDAHPSTRRAGTEAVGTAQRQDVVAAEQQAIALQKAVNTQTEFNVKLAETGGHYRVALALQQQLLASQTEIAVRELSLAEAELARLGAENKNTEEYAKQLVLVQSLKNNLGTTIRAQIIGVGAQAAQEHPLDPQTAANSAETKAAAEMAAAATSAYNFAVTFASLLGISSTQLKVLADAAAAAAQAQKDLANNTHPLLSALSDVANDMSKLEGGVNDYLNGSKNGKGFIGGAGAVLNDPGMTGKNGLLSNISSELLGPDSPITKAVPIIGPLIGGMFQTITSLFQAGIEKMVKTINDTVQSIQTQASSGQIGLGQEIIELQQAKQDAINELGGSKKKGAQNALNNILTQLNAQIGQLMFQQQQIINNFQQMTTAGGLNTLTGTFASWYQTWQGINQQVQAYVDAGGSVDVANQYLNQQLAIQRQTLTDQLNQGDQTALNDAIQLNQLLTQRSQLMKQEAETEFGLINADSEERRVSSAVQIGSQLQNQRYQYSQQLLQLNNQITLDQERLTVEGQIFDVNKNLADLQAASNALTIASLNEQLAKYQDMQAILKSTAGLTFSGPISNVPTATLPIPGEPTVAGPITMGNITINVDGNVDSTTVATLGSEIARNLRSGRTTFPVSTQ